MYSIVPPLEIDSTIKTQDLTAKQREKINDYKNPLYWQNLAENKQKPYLYNKELSKYKSIAENHSENLQAQINNLIIKKWQKLTDISETKLNEYRKQNFEQSELLKKGTAKINHLYRGLLFAKSKKRCLVTGLPIDMQKENSRFICTKGITYYLDHYPEIYDEILLPRLSGKWKTKPHKTQYEEIAHSIRNAFFNKKHNTKRSIEKINSYPTLFDNKPYIDPHKLRDAGFMS
jgi:hypothetical protein